MSSLHDDLMAGGGRGVLLGAQGESGRVVLVDPGGTTYAVTAIVGRAQDADAPEQPGGGRRRVRTRRLTVGTDEVAGVTVKWTVTLDAEPLAILSVTHSAGFYVLLCQEVRVLERGAPNYRQRGGA